MLGDFDFSLYEVNKKSDKNGSFDHDKDYSNLDKLCSLSVESMSLSSKTFLVWCMVNVESRQKILIHSV